MDFHEVERQFAHLHRWAPSRRLVVQGLTAAGLLLPLLTWGRRAQAQQATCRTTQSVPIEGPYYLGEPRTRERTGTGLVLRGTVRDATTCEPIPGATVVRWHANEFGIYEDYYRAKMTADSGGGYRLESIIPGTYAGLARHVHFLVKAPGYQDLITQWQLADGLTPEPEITFDFALRRV